MKNLANIVTASRMVLAAALFLTPVFSTGFWICYLCGGLSDLLDGPIARMLKQTSSAGARLDSIADLAFAVAIAAAVIKNVALPEWIWLLAALTVLLRCAGYGIGFYKYRAFSALHTYMNKAAGALIFAFPLLFTLLGLETAGAILCLTALISALEELAITVKSKELRRDCKGLFIQ